MGQGQTSRRQPDLRKLRALNRTPSVHPSIAEIGREVWDAAASPSGNPFVSYDFLHILEESGCVSAESGWSPCHLALDGAVMPLYLKTHSQGEYVFDHGWAQAYERAGGAYYPKLQSAVPFTPVTGPRLMGADPAARRALLIAAANLTAPLAASSLHITFLEEDEWRLAGEVGLLLRQDLQFHWKNNNYATFDDFLAQLSSSHRKTIRRERRLAAEGLEIHALTGAELTEAHWDAFFAFYMDTGSRKWGRPYLNRKFFSLLGERMADKVLLIIARRGGHWIAGALNLIGRDALYGRNWGSVEDIPFLHFELCYYQAIEQAIDLGLSRVEAGAQGPHKIARGYLPAPVYSAHYIADRALRAPVARYLEQERAAVTEEMQALSQAYSPFSQG
ncbi:MAG: GNAT family N-acetyltransferase [Alphaproteobacteria bacterium]